MSDSRDPISITPIRETPPSAWRRAVRAHPAVVTLVAAALLLLFALDVWVMRQRARYSAEIDRLRASMTQLERARTDAIVSHETSKVQLALALLRRQADVEPGLHLAVSIDTGAMYLQRDGAMLRRMPVQIGRERRVGVPPDTVRVAAPLGVRTVARVMDDTSRWEVPVWVYADRGVAADSSRVIPGALGPVAIMLEGGTVIYSTARSGPLSDSLYVMPGAVRARVEDLRAIVPNLTPGMRVYFY